MWENISSQIEKFSGLITAFGVLLFGWILNKKKSDSEVKKTETDETIALQRWNKERVQDLIASNAEWERKAEKFEFMYQEIKKLYDEMKTERDDYQRQVNVLKNFHIK